jgi:hypothetical protein
MRRLTLQEPAMPKLPDKLAAADGDDARPAFDRSAFEY